MYQVLSTKKLNPVLVASSKEKDIDIREQEFISIRLLNNPEKYNEVWPWIISDSPATAVFTSANAVEAIKLYLHPGPVAYVPDWKVYCLEGKTKESLAPYIPESALAGTAENAAALARKIVQSDAKEVVFFCGNKRRDELPRILEQHGITVHEITVYETTEVPDVTTTDLDGIIFFSPSAVSSFFSVNELSVKTVCFAIGPTTARAIADFTDNKLIVSEAPSQEMMIACVQFYFQNINCYE